MTTLPKMKQLFYIFLVIIFSACSFHKGTFDSSVSLQKNNFEIINVLESSAKAVYFLGIGGNELSGLYKKAKNEMYAEHPLKEGQALANITTDVKTFWLGPLVIQRMTITADVVQFNSVSDTTLYQRYINTEQFKAVLGERAGGLQRTFSTPVAGSYIISHHKNGYILLEKASSYLLPQPDGSIVKGNYVSRGKENDLYAFINESSEMIYAFDEEVFVRDLENSELSVPIEIGQEIEYTRNGAKFSGKVIGLGLKSALIKGNNSNDTVLYDQLFSR
jgi:hypothetical protein